MLESGAQWWETPDILPWQSWLSALHDQALASGVSNRLRVSKLRQQRHWRRCIDEDMAGNFLLDPEASAVLAQQARSISCQWQCANEADDYLSADQWAYERWLANYLEYQQVHALIDDSAVADHLAELIAEDAQCLNLPKTLLLAGFINLSPQQQALLMLLQDSGVSIHSDGSEEAAVDVPLFRSTLQTTESAVKVHSYDDDDAELRALAEQIREQNKLQADAQLAVVVSNLKQQRWQVLRAFDSVFFPTLSADQIALVERPYDISLGQSLCDWPVVATAMLLLQLPLRGLQGAEVSDLLLSPHVIGSDAARRARQRVDLQLRDKRIGRLDLGGLINSLDAGDVLRSTCAAWKSGLDLSDTSLSEWASRFGSWLKDLGWPGESCGSEEYQAIQAWYTCLDDLQSLDEGELTNFSESLVLIMRLSRERIFQPEAPAKPIQIMGRLESHGMSFDRLWVTGLDAEQWPAGSTPSPFLSIARQKRSGVVDASPALRLAQARREFALWKRASPCLTLSRSLIRCFDTRTFC